MIINDKLHALRTRAGLTQDQVAVGIGVSQAAVCAWENDAQPRSRSLKKIADFYKIPVESLSEESSLPSEHSLVLGSLRSTADVDEVRAHAAMLRRVASELDLLAARLEGRQ